MNWQEIANWLIHSGMTLGQAYIAYQAQTDPRWAWASPALGVIQSGMPSPKGVPGAKAILIVFGAGTVGWRLIA